MAKKYEFEIQSAFTKQDMETSRKKNLDWAKEHLLTTGVFQTSVWIYTDGNGNEPQNIYYILTNPEISKDQNESPLDQIEPIILMFGTRQSQFGRIMGYQVVSETWVKAFGRMENKDMPQMKHGDIAKMSNKEEWFLEQYVKRGFDLKTTAFEIVRADDSDEIEDLVLIKDINKMQSGKLPPL